MFKFQIEGVKSFIDNLKDIKLNDKVLLKKNLNNKFSNEAIGIYLINNKKIGYAPFIYSQHIHLNLEYYIVNINLSKKEFIIGCLYPETNYLDIIKPDDSNKNINNNHDLYLFKKKLEIIGLNITDIKVLYADDNFIDIKIISNNKINIFYTVTKKYYDNNLIKFTEFYDNKLIKFNVYIPFFTHRLEEYIIRNYNHINAEFINEGSNNLINKKKIYYNHNKKIFWFE
jgi:hypothetical protein